MTTTSPPTTPLQRRNLKLDSVDAVLADARHLLVAGYGRAGNWSLGQACWHLTTWLRYSFDGFPSLPLLARPGAWAFRHTLGPAYLQYLLKGGSIPRGIPAPLGTAPPAVVDDVEGVTRYEEQLNRLRDFRGVPHPSPLFGRATPETLVRHSCTHAAHHLSFLVPNDLLATPPAAATNRG